MIQASGIRPLDSIESINDLSEVSSAQAQALGDVFSQKIGAWAFATPQTTVHNERFDVPSRFAITPPDGIIMDYLEEMGNVPSLPVAHLYDSALEVLAQKIDEPTIKQLLEEDIALRDFLRAKRIGEVYE